MALTSSQRSYSFKPPSFKTPHSKYDVFLSFRGEDIRDNFLEYLYRALCQKGISSFKDDIKLKYGEKINNELLEAIEESNISVVVLSENYANSSWCLRELVHIIERKRDNGPVVYPIFYHVSPSDVRKQEGAFGEGFAKACLKNEEEEVNRWRDALEEVSNLRGWCYPNTAFENEAKLIDNLAHEIFDISNDRYRIPHEGLVGIRSRMMEVINLLDLGSDETRVVGLWGMGGIGKTTLAKVVYDHIFRQFEGCSFIDNVRDVFERSGVLPLQKQLISDILSENTSRVTSAIGGIGTIQDRVCRKKVLIVLDDVSNTKQVEDLLPNLKQYRRGSRIIITSRDKQVLKVCRVQDVLNVQKLDKDEAMQLFKSKAFAECEATGEFYRLIDRALQYADGVPLALKVLGSLLLGGNVPKWGSLLDRLGNSLDGELQKVLKISYDGLSWKDQQIFLDICCFFKGVHKDKVVRILDSCGFDSVFGIEVLVEKSLLTISADDCLLMHDLVEKMGWSIVDEESRNEPGERSRLWRFDDIKHVLVGNRGTNKIECIECQDPQNLELQHDTFANMTNLRILTVSTAHSSPKFSIYLPNTLRVLCWNGYPSKYMPSTFQPEHLVELHLTGSHIKRLWGGTMVLPKLTVMNLRSSTSLTKSPDFSGFPNLEALFLEGCNALGDIDPSIKDLKRLRILDLKDCSRLKTLPYGIKSQFFGLIFSGCSKLVNILECFDDLKQLLVLDLDGTSIKELPESIGNSTDLYHLSCSSCKKLKSIPSSIAQLKKLKYLSFKECSSLSKLPFQQLFFCAFFPKTSPSTSQISNKTLWDFSGFLYLTEIHLFGLSSFPESISLCFSLKTLVLNGDFESLHVGIKDLRNLEELMLISCQRLQKLPELPPNVSDVSTYDCDSLRTICTPTILRDARILRFLGSRKLVGSEEINVLLGFKYLYDQIKENNHLNWRLYSGPGSEIPEWIRYKTSGGSLAFPLPIEDRNTSKLVGFAFSFMVATKHRFCEIFVKTRIGGKVLELRQFVNDKGFLFPSYSENVMIYFLPIEKLIDDDLTHTSGNVLEVCFSTGGTENRWKPASEVKACGVHLIYEEEVGPSGEKGEVATNDYLKGT